MNAWMMFLSTSLRAREKMTHSFRRRSISDGSVAQLVICLDKILIRALPSKRLDAENNQLIYSRALSRTRLSTTGRHQSKRLQKAGVRWGGAVLLALAMTSSIAAGCGKHKYGSDDLTRDLHEYHRNIRWSRPAPVLARVHPDLRAAFAKEWDRRVREVQIQEVEVVDVQISEDGDVAEVTVMMTWIHLDTQRLEQGTVQEQWRRTDKGWRSMKMFEIPKPGGATQFQSL